MDSKQKGNWGLASAIEFFAGEGYTVSIPLTDSQRYDLIVEKEGKLSKVQVKSSHRQSENNSWRVGIRSTSIRKKGPTVITLFDNSEVDFVFVLLGNRERYLIPSHAIKSKTQININKTNFEKFKVL